MTEDNITEDKKHLDTSKSGLRQLSRLSSMAVEGAQAVSKAVTDFGGTVTDKAMSVAVQQLLSSMDYACKKVRASSDELPDNTKLIVSASVLGIVTLSLEVPVKSIKEKVESNENN